MCVLFELLTWMFIMGFIYVYVISAILGNNVPNIIYPIMGVIYLSGTCGWSLKVLDKLKNDNVTEDIQQ